MEIDDQDLRNQWARMIRSCFYKDDPRYIGIGDRGVRMDPQWLPFAKFRAWALKSGYRAGRKLRRVMAAGDYSASNCVWS